MRKDKENFKNIQEIDHSDNDKEKAKLYYEKDSKNYKNMHEISAKIFRKREAKIILT